MSWIQVRSCVKQYKGVTIQYPDITVEDKNILLVGRNGSGKSTLLYAMMGWVKYQGIINVKGSLAMMTERPMFPRDVTVETLLKTLCPDLDNTLIQTYQLEEKKEVYISSLSKGMKAKVNLLQCIGLERDIYLFDEPINGLDEHAIAAFINWLQTTRKRWIIATHKPELFDCLSCEVIVLDPSS
jgi:ABC-2 type transport system ATP-binding protein